MLCSFRNYFYKKYTLIKEGKYLSKVDKNKYVLVIDDDITALDLVSFLFEKRGYNVRRTPSGFEAIELVKKECPDLILVDLRMPGLNGVQTVTRIRNLEDSKMPIIAFTAVDDSDLHNEAIEAGCNEVIVKPCPSKRLIRVIESYLN